MASSEAPQDPRPYVRMSTDLPLNPKLAAIDSPAASWAYVVSICYCGGSFTDGHFPLLVVLRLAGVEKPLAEALVEQGLWHLPGHDCDRCPQPKPGQVYIHDYLQHQRSADEVKDLTNKRRAAGRKGAEQRWSKAAEPKRAPEPEPSEDGDEPEPMASAMASAMANAQQELWQNDGKPMAEERRGEEKKERGTRKRGTRLPTDFSVTPDMVAWAQEHCPKVDGRRETEKFKNHWWSKSRDATRLDWVLTWRNWMLRAAEYTADRTPGQAAPSTAPDRIPKAERCLDHADQRAVSCRHCAARTKAGHR